MSNNTKSFLTKCLLVIITIACLGIGINGIVKHKNMAYSIFLVVIGTINILTLILSLFTPAINRKLEQKRKQKERELEEAQREFDLWLEEEEKRAVEERIKAEQEKLKAEQEKIFKQTPSENNSDDSNYPRVSKS